MSKELKVKLPERLANLKVYKPGKPDGEVALSNGKTSIFLSSNENNYGPSPAVKNAIQNTISEINLYPNPAGGSLRKAISAHVNRPESEIFLSHGSDSIIGMMYDAFVERDEHVLTCEYSFPAVDVQAGIRELQVVKLPMTKDYGFDLDGILAHITSKTKIIYICNPNNPTGSYIVEPELRSFIDKVPEDVLLVMDEAYFEYGRHMIEGYPDTASWQKPNILTVRTFSKGYGLAGMRLGYALGHEKIINALYKVRLPFSPNRLAQAAGIAAIQDQDYLKFVMDQNESALKRIYELMDHLGWHYIPSGGNYVMVTFKNEEEAKNLFSYLKDQGILTRPLYAFGLDHCLRISTGTTKEINQLIETLSLEYV